MATVSNNLPSIPAYFKMYVDGTVDLTATPHIPCPFHNETHGKSFSYSEGKNVWRCFGQCHCGGDVIDLHRLNYHLKSRDEAKSSLYSIYGIVERMEISFERPVYTADAKDVYRRRAYAMAVQLATSPKDWVELDYILSKVPYDVTELEVFCSSRGYVINSERKV